MPGTTRYSATFDRPYEEEANPETASAAANGSRRSRSQSLQSLGVEGRPYTPLGNNRFSQRSSSTDSGSSKGVENIPTRTLSKTVVKTHNNPFQFVKVGSCPMYRKAEDQLKKVKEVKKVEVLQEEEEDWQLNLDSWKSRRRKMSEDVFRRQEEIRQFELEEQMEEQQANQKKTKTFSEMVESRAHRGRTLSLCLISSPLDLQKWDLENNSSTNSRHPHSEGSEQNSAVNSEDEGVSENRKMSDLGSYSNGSDIHAVKNGSSNTSKNKTNKLLELGENCLPLKDGIYIDSGLESISSSHRTGDTPDSCSDFSQDSGSSIDCDSPRVSGLILNGVNVLEDYNLKSAHNSHSNDSFTDMKARSLNNSLDKNASDTTKSSVSNDKSNGLIKGTCNGTKPDVSENSASSNSKEKNVERNSSLKSNNERNSEKMVRKQERSIESENEVFVDDFEELNADVKVFSSTNKEAKGKILATNNEAALTGTVELSKPSSNSSSNSLNTVESISCNDSATGIADESSRIKQMDNLASSVQNSTSKFQNIDEKSSAAGKIISDSHSQDKKIDPVVKQKDAKKKPVKKKKLKENVVSVETDVKKLDPVETQSKCIKKLGVEEDSLNIVFQSQSSSNSKDSQDNVASETNTCIANSKEHVLLNDVLPVEKIAEEMERLILQQLEEEERAKDLPSKNPTINAVGSPEHLIAPSRVSEPPKEKPPPPPKAENEVQKPTSLKRVNSTKRIKKEIHKRRSNFLGIENTDQSLGCDESKIQPPPALEQILKAEMELDRESRKRLESAAEERIKLEENEIVEKEREIIETLESEERQKNLINNEEICGIMLEEDRIQKLKEERKRMESERAYTEAQRLRLEEEKQLKEREEYIRKQEVPKSPSTETSAPVLSEVANKSNIPKSPIASLSTETKLNVKLSNIAGDGEIISNSASQTIDCKSGENVGKPVVPPKPAVPPKPLKKKEVIRKERERLRQEQEALQREREEHRKKLLMEQDEITKAQQKTHAPTSPVSRIGPLPFKSAYTSQLTNPLSSQPCVRENVIFSSQSFHGAQNGISTGTGCIGPVVSKSKPVQSHKKSNQNEPLVQQKVSSVKKQSHDPVTESKYNQNHWLIQEAEMRRITELKERQHAGHFPISQTHLSGDDVCSNSSHVPISPPNMLVNPPVQEKVWSYGHANIPMKKFPPPVSSEKPLGIYSRDPAPQPPSKPSRVVPLEKQEQMLSVSGRKRCSHCNEELGRGAAMIIESLQLYYHIHCFQCCVCQAQLGNGSCGTDVRVRNNKLHCHNCYSNDEAGLKFSQV